MKRRTLCLFVVLILCFAFPLTAYAKTYNMNDTDISIGIDDASWYVFTRDNLQNNSELKELGITPDAMRSILDDNMAYMDALLFYEDGDILELLIRKNKIENSFTNLSNYSYEQVLELAEAFGKRQNTKNYSVYENQYKFVRLEYFDSTYDYYICEFITIVNKDNYTLTFQSPSPFTDWELDEIQNIVDSIKFDVDSSIEELTPTSSEERDTPSIFEQAVETGITAAISGGLLAIMALLFGKVKKAGKTKKSDNVPELKKSPEMELNSQVTPEKFESQPKAIHEDKTTYSQESISQKDVAVDNGFEDIKKYKELLDLGIITQEEFDTKKKELLGL